MKTTTNKLNVRAMMTIVGVLAYGASALAVPPANDECDAAETVSNGVSGTAVNCEASTDIDDPIPSCMFGTNYGSVFFEFVATQTSARIRTDLDSFAGDSEFAVYAVDDFSPCDKSLWSEVACVEDGDFEFNGDTCVEGLIPGDTYKIMLVSFSSASCGEYTVDIVSPCSGAPIDNCPNDPNKTEPGQCGCGVPDTDSDGDGVADCIDVCPGGDDTVDNDGDGVPDACDVCPGGDDTIDNDADGVPDDCDVCPDGDDNVDSDGDGVPDDCDACPNDNPDDSDGDGVCDSEDVCPGGDDALDDDGDGVPDFCDLCPGGDDNVDDNGNGVPDACDFEPPILAPAPHDILKNRYISIDPRGAGGLNTGKDLDIRVTLSGTQVSGVTVVGSVWWANPPDADCIAVVGSTRPAVPPNWDACPTLHLTGCPIIPTSTYDIVVVSDGTDSAPPLAAATQAKPGIKWHGDVVGSFTGTEWTAPNGQTSIDDAVAAIKTFQNPSNTPGCPTPPCNATHVSVTDMEPNLPGGPEINSVVNIADVFSIILGFQGFEYPGSDLAQCQ